MITLYSKHCPICLMVETALKNSGLDYSIDENVDSLIEKGFHSQPVLFTGNEYLTAPQAISWIKEHSVNSKEASSELR